MLDVSGYKFVIEKELLEKAAPMKIDMTYMGFSITSKMELGGGESGGGGCGSSCSGGSCSMS